jgi:hypothetical protein
MVKRVRSFGEIRLNLFQALKRAYIIERGIVPRHKPPETQAEPPSKKRPARQNQSAKETSPKEDGESYPERVAAGEDDKDVEADNEDANDSGQEKLKSEVEGSKTAKGPEDLVEITEQSQDVLYEADTVWPFTMFPDTIKLDREKLTMANRFFWRVATITSVPVGEIMSAEAYVGPFFGSLDLTFRFFTNNERKIKFLWRKDAVELQRLIHGYIIAHRREIDVSAVNKEDLIKLLTELGQGASD